MTTTEPELIPPAFWPAIELTPHCMVLRRAIADALEEAGDSVGAEAMRWSVEKGRSPMVGKGIERSTQFAGWLTEVHSYEPYGLPDALYPQEIPLTLGHCDKEPCYSFPVACALMRLTLMWKRTTPDQKEVLWQWKPKRR